MSNRIIRRGKLWHEYSICLHAGGHGEATKVRFGPHDRWVGDHYWWHVRTYKPSRQQRAFLLMSQLENRDLTNTLRYQKARAVVLTEMGYASAAAKHLKDWRDKHESNGSIR